MAKDSSKRSPILPTERLSGFNDPCPTRNDHLCSWRETRRSYSTAGVLWWNIQVFEIDRIGWDLGVLWKPSKSLPPSSSRMIKCRRCRHLPKYVCDYRLAYPQWREPGETPENALKREILEELSTEISIDEFLCTVEYDYPKFHLTMHCFWCHVDSGSLTLKEHEAARWLQRDELDSVEWLPADKIIIEKLKTS